MRTKDIKKFIDENVNTYKSYSRITSDYRGEKALTDAYNGRQLLEMLQNADDAQTDKVALALDTKNGILSIANNGIPFDIKGLGSLMLANNSPKNKRGFIGNKGLGFRSILNWVDVVKIKTKVCILEFSKEIAKNEFERLVPDFYIRQQIIENEKDLPNGEIPFAILAIPDFKENTGSQDWETIIELKYKKEFENNILEQLEAIKPEVLLFLNHTKEIKISGTELLDKELILTKNIIGGKTTLTVNDKTWNLYDSGEESLPKNTEKFFRYKIAWQNDLSDVKTPFATYFPTQVATHLPYLIHATFDLDPSRNHFNKSDDNEYILKQIAASLKEIAITEIVDNDKPDWKALDFLTVDGKSENKFLEAFYQSIEIAKIELALYPTVDGYYKKVTEVKYYGNDFSEWVVRNNLEAYFPDLLSPVPLHRIAIVSKISSKYAIEKWKSIFETATHKIEGVDERVGLIKLLVKDIFKELHGIKLPLLLDQDKKVVESEIEVFTLRKGSTDMYQIPNYVDIAFIDDGLYFKLENAFAEEIEKARNSPTEHKSRPLKKIVDRIVNLGSNDITDVIRNITKAFNSKVAEDSSNAQELVKPFINSLYQIFKQKKDGERTSVDNIKVLNREGNLVLSSDVFLGNEYQYGKTTENLFENILEDCDYIIGNDFWNLQVENTSMDYLDSFFIWLGVNKYSKFKNLKKNLQRWENDDYSNFVFNKIGSPQYQPHRNYEVSVIDNFESTILKYMAVEKLIAWIILDRKLFSKLDNDNNNETFIYSYGNNTTTVNSKPSYFLYQIAKSKIAENIFVDFEFAAYLGLKSINPEHQIFKDLGIDKTAVLDVLKKLGAKMSFNELNIEAIYALLNLLKEKDTEFKNARKMYQQAFSYFKNHNQEDFEMYLKQTNTLATKNGKKEYRPTEEVYYSDNTTLPSKIIEDFWIMDFPKRSGEKQVADYFGVKTFKDITIEFNDEKISIHNALEEFNNWLHKIKPHILTYRLNAITSTTLQTSTVTALKNSTIKIVSQLEYSVNGGDPKWLNPNEFINKDRHLFYIGAEPNLTLEQLKDTPPFCEAFAEILCVLFEVNDNKDDFRNIFKDKLDLKDSKYLIETKMLTEKFEEARQLLGIAKNEMQFWKAITKDKVGEFPETVSNTLELQKMVLKTINFELTDNYGLVNFETFRNQQSYSFIENICSSQNLTLTEIKLRLDNFPGLKYFHLEKFKQTALDVEIIWNRAWWLHLSDKPKELQVTFENKRNVYLQNRGKIIEKLAEKHTWDIVVNYEEELFNQLSSEFNIVIQKENLINIVIENKYQKLTKENSINIEDLSFELKSLLFFEGHEEELKIKFAELIKEETETAESSNSEDEGTVSVSSVITSIGIGNTPIIKTNIGIGNKKGAVHSQKRELQNIKAGKRAEKLVWDKLKELYPNGEIRWISGNSEDNNITLDDTKGYDISYKKNKTEEQWKYLEVKSSLGNSFIISTNEVTVGIQYKEDYHLALVKGQNIYFVEDFFLDETRLAEFNVLRNSASIRPLDYEVFYSIPAQKKPKNTSVEIENL